MKTGKALLVVVLSLVTMFTVPFVAPLVAQYFWESFIVGITNIQTPAYWTMFALVAGIRWMLLSNISSGVASIASTVKQSLTIEEKTKDLASLWYVPWAQMLAIVVITYLCK